MSLRDAYRRLSLRLRALVARRRVDRDIDDELTFHLEMETRKLVAAGLGAEEARARASARFGSASLAAEECREAAGTRLVDQTIQDVAYALRTVRRMPTVALTVVGTVALGLGLVAAAFTIFNVFVFRVDAVRDPDTLVFIQGTSVAGRSPSRPFTLAQVESLRRENTVFADVTARLADITTRIDGRMMEGHLVTGTFFQVLGVPAAHGRTLRPSDDQSPAGQPVIVLSHDGWTRHFSADPTVMGRTVLVNGARFAIVGVTPEGFRGLGAFGPDYWAPISLASQFRRREPGYEQRVAVEVFARLKPDVSRATARAALNVWASHGTMDLASADARRGAGNGVSLEPAGTAMPFSSSALLAFSPLFLASGLILLIGCANVANLLLARAVARQREFGIRLSLGASRSRVVRQLLTESLLLALVSAIVAWILSRIVLDGTTTVLMRTMPPELAEFLRLAAPGADWRVVAFLVIAAFATTLLFGLAPALRATRLDLVRTMRGELTRDARPGRARNALIVVQVTASALLLICAAVFLRSALRATAADPGLRMADNVIVEGLNEPTRRATIAAVMAEPLVAAVAASWPEAAPLGRTRAAYGSPAASGESASTSRSPTSYRLVSAEYFDVLGIEVMKGRAFTPAEAASNAAVAIVSEATARQIWPHDDAIGQVLRLEPVPQATASREVEPTLSAHTFVVVGVARGVAGFRLGEPEAGVYVPTSANTVRTSLIARVHGDPDVARRVLIERLTAIEPNLGMVMTMRTLSRLESYPLQSAFWLTVTLGGLALVLTLSGIFSVLSYLVEQRSKEIGVRMAMGATTGSIVRLVLRQSLRLVTGGLVGGGLVAWALATIVMSTPVATRFGTLVDVFDPLAYTASVLCIALACLFATTLPALRAARIDPYAILHRD